MSPRPWEIAMRGNGYVFATSGAVAVCFGALLPFMWHSQASVAGTQVLSGFGIGLGYRVISFLFGALLTGLAYWTRRRPRPTPTHPPNRNQTTPIPSRPAPGTTSFRSAKSQDEKVQ